MTFKNIKKERLKLNLTQEQLAKKLNTSRSNVANWENSQNNPSIEMLFKCSELFGCSIAYLAGYSMEEKGENMQAKEILDLASRQWADTKEIQKLACVGENKARQIKKQIQSELHQKNVYLPNNKIPMSDLIEYLHININYLKKVERS